MIKTRGDMVALTLLFIVGVIVVIIVLGNWTLIWNVLSYSLPPEWYPQ